MTLSPGEDWEGVHWISTAGRTQSRHWKSTTVLIGVGDDYDNADYDDNADYYDNADVQDDED